MPVNVAPQMSESSLPPALFLQGPHHAVHGARDGRRRFRNRRTVVSRCSEPPPTSLGWIYLPDMGFFRRWVEKRKNAAAESAARIARSPRSLKKRDAVLAALSVAFARALPRRSRQVCRDIETGRRGERSNLRHRTSRSDTRLRKLDELMWMYLRLLSTEQSLETFLESEDREDLPGEVAAAEEELRRHERRTGAAQASGSSDKRAAPARIAKRTSGSIAETIATTSKKREANLALVLAEQERLSEQIKLIRADAVATRNAEALSARIDASVAHLDETNDGCPRSTNSKIWSATFRVPSAHRF